MIDGLPALQQVYHQVEVILVDGVVQWCELELSTLLREVEDGISSRTSSLVVSDKEFDSLDLPEGKSIMKRSETGSVLEIK